MSAPQGPPEPSEHRPEQVRIRRSPKILSFLLAGALLGAVVALILTIVFPENGEYPVSQVFGFLLVLGVVVGATIGAIVALLFERSSQRRAREVDAVREVSAPPSDPAGPTEQVAPEPTTPGPEDDSRPRP